MPPRKKGTVNLTVDPSYVLPSWFSSATPQQVGAALSFAASIIPTLGDPSSKLMQVQQDCLQAREEQLAKHEASLQAMVSDARTHSETARESMQARIDELYATKVEQDEVIASITAERDELLRDRRGEAARGLLPGGEHHAGEFTWDGGGRGAIRGP